MKTFIPLLSFFVSCIFLCCSTDKAEDSLINTTEAARESSQGSAIVTQVKISGDEDAYSFSVTMSSPDTGCEQYADWWEVVDTDGNLIYRRILAHSHVEEQPFTRSGGPIAISTTTEVYIRAHMNNTGYGSAIFKGSVDTGFSAAQLDETFAEVLEKSAPLPDDCAF